jgi:hypothetical protein
LRDRKDADRESDDEKRQSGEDNFRQRGAGAKAEYGANKSLDAISEATTISRMSDGAPPPPASRPSGTRTAPKEEPAQPGQEPAVQVRSDFRSTILWQPDIRTDENGNATVKVKYPDSLTTWSATAR